MQVGKKLHGFTIIELLITIVIIGILATIFIVSYTAITQRAKETTVKNDLLYAASKLKAIRYDSGTYPSDLTSAGSLATGGTTYQYSYNSSNNSYCLTGTNQNLSWYITSSDATPSVGGCVGHGVNGAPAVTNLATNPSFETNLTSHAGARGTLTRVTTTAFAGTASAQYVADGTSGGNYLSSTVQTGDISNKQITGSIRVKRSGTAANMVLRMYYRNSSNTIIGPAGGVNGTSVAVGTDWTGATVSGTAPAGTTNVVFYSLFSTTLPNSATFWFDGLMTVVGNANSQYADGDTPNWLWNGTPHNSTSTGSAL